MAAALVRCVRRGHRWDVENAGTSEGFAQME
jgi:hypothetical protein